MNHKLDYESSSTEEEELSDVDSFEDVSMESESSESDVSSESEYDSDEEADLSWCWQVLVDEAADQHETERLKIIEHLVSEGETEASAVQIANAKILPAVKKEIRKILVEKFEWMHLMKRDPNFQKIMKTKKELLETGDYDWLEAIKLAVHNRKYLLNELLPQYLQNTYSIEENISDGAME